MDSFTSYCKPLHVAHKGVRRLLDQGENLWYQEKVDGSQISFGKALDGTLWVRSKNKVFDIEAPDQMFQKAVASIKDRASSLRPGLVYRGEYLQKEKHNCLAYSRVPEGNIAVYDVATGLHDYISDWKAAASEARQIGLEFVPVLHVGKYNLQTLERYMERESFLGGPRVEGIVLKDHTLGAFGLDGRPIMAKYVCESFKESMKQTFKPARDRSIYALANEAAKIACTEARWRKAVQHLREDGRLSEDPSDIGPLIKELHSDIEEEAADLIKDYLYSQFKKQVLKIATDGFPEWYKKQLMEGL